MLIQVKKAPTNERAETETRRKKISLKLAV